MAIKSAAALASSFAARFPNAGQAGTVDSLSASADSGSLDTVQAMAVKGYASISGKLVWVRAKANFYQGFDIQHIGDYVQVPEDDSKRLVYQGKAELASDEDVAKAQKASK